MYLNGDFQHDPSKCLMCQPPTMMFRKFCGCTCITKIHMQIVLQIRPKVSLFLHHNKRPCTNKNKRTSPEELHNVIFLLIYSAHSVSVPDFPEVLPQGLVSWHNGRSDSVFFGRREKLDGKNLAMIFFRPP